MNGRGHGEFVVHGMKRDESGIPVGIRRLESAADYFQ
jgi:hypothetical protein